MTRRGGQAESFKCYYCCNNFATYAQVVLHQAVCSPIPEAHPMPVRPRDGFKTSFSKPFPPSMKLEASMTPTPRPWKDESGAIYSADGKPIADCLRVLNVDNSASPYEANAAHIVRCVNAHDALVAALKHAASSCHHPACKCKGEYAAMPEQHCTCHVQKCRAALAAYARGRT